MTGLFWPAVFAERSRCAGSSISVWRPPGSSWRCLSISPWQYLISESSVILHYLRLVFWPRPLCLDYHWPLAGGLGSVWLPCVTVAGLLALAAWCLWRHPRVGFLGASFFIILAPTSSI